MDLLLPPRIELARLPTPIQEMKALSRMLGKPVYVKRDDLTECVATGNKIRKLEYLLAEAKAIGAQVLITAGPMQSNHCRATAAAARMLGLDPHLVLRGSEPEKAEGNYFLDRLLGAETTFITADDYRLRRGEIMDGIAKEYSARGRRAYVIPEGGSSPTGCLGYVRCAMEIRDFCAGSGVQFGRIYHAAGSGGTTSGLALGAELCGLGAEILGVNVGGEHDSFVSRIRGIISEAAEGFSLPLAVPPEEVRFSLVEGYAGPGYGRFGPEVPALIRDVARTTGIVLDPVYTAKAMLGLMGEERRRQDGASVLFVHTGGVFGLFDRTGEVLGGP